MNGSSRSLGRLWSVLLLVALVTGLGSCKKRAIDDVATLAPEDVTVVSVEEPEVTGVTETAATEEPTAEATGKPKPEATAEPTTEPEATPEATSAPIVEPEAQGFAATTQEAQAMFGDRGLAFETWGFSRGFPRHYGSSEDYVTVAQVVGAPEALLSASVVTSVKPNNPQDFLQKSEVLYSLLDVLLPAWEERATWLSDNIKAGLAAPADQPYAATTTQNGVSVEMTVSRWTEAVGLELILEGPDPGLVVGEGLVLRYDAFAEKDVALNLDVSTYTPRLEGGEGEAVAAFNARAAGLVQEQVSSLRNGLGGEAIPDPGGMVQVDYQVTYASPELLSLLFDVGTYTGGAHPNSYALVLNYNLKAGTELTLDSLFAAGYLEALAQYCQKDLASRDRLEFPEGAEPTAENYRNWSITAEGILITFDAYQVGPYAMGPQSVVVPYAELSSLLLPDGSLSPLLQ